MTTITENNETSVLLVRMTQEESSLPVYLSPLVVLNITHDATRMQQCQQGGAARPALGILLGRTTDDGGTEIASSFEIIRREGTTPATLDIDWPTVKRKRDRLAEVFPELVVVGWYGVGSTKGDAMACCSVMQAPLCETFDDVSDGMMLAMKVDCAPSANLATLPVYLFEATVVHNCNPGAGEQAGKGTAQSHSAANQSSQICCAIPGQAHKTVSLRSIRFPMMSDDIAQVGVDAAICNIRVDNNCHTRNTSTMPSHLHRVEQSLRLLKRRIVMVTQYLKAVESRCIAQPSPDALRHLAKVSAMLTLNSHKAPAHQAADVAPFIATNEVGCTALAVTLLSLQTKCAVALGDLARTQKRAR